METSLHKQLKAHYGGPGAQTEIWVDEFRIDTLSPANGELIEIQSAELGALRDKVRVLLARGHRLRVVKPLAIRKRILTLECAGGEVVSCRASPKHESFYDVFGELVHFVGTFPHPALTLEVVLTEQEEIRIPIRARRRRAKNYRVQDRALLGITERRVFRTASDLCRMLPEGLGAVFSTAEMANLAGIPRWLAQKMAYCLRKTDAVRLAGKRRNSLLYELLPQPVPKRRRKAAA